jgi:hypothetical protein
MGGGVPALPSILGLDAAPMVVRVSADRVVRVAIQTSHLGDLHDRRTGFVPESGSSWPALRRAHRRGLVPAVSLAFPRV